MLNKQSGNMYGFITHTWNTIKGQCYHDCSYCYMKRFKNQKSIRFDEKELKTDLGLGNFIFVGSSCDMFANDIPDEWIDKTLEYCKLYPENKYLFQTKNPYKTGHFNFPDKSILCLTLESNLNYPGIYKNSPIIRDRVNDFIMIDNNKKMITIEPILNFDLNNFIFIIQEIFPFQVNIGADSGHNNLPEPPKEKILQLIYELSRFTQVYQKDNLKRILEK